MMVMKEIAIYGAEDVCSSLDSERLRLMACRSPLAVPNRYVGPNLPFVSAYPIPLFINNSKENAKICQLVAKFMSG